MLIDIHVLYRWLFTWCSVYLHVVLMSHSFNFLVASGVFTCFCALFLSFLVIAVMCVLILNSAQDQIVFPDEAIFEKVCFVLLWNLTVKFWFSSHILNMQVEQASGRVYILKFNTDDRKFFFWMQVSSTILNVDAWGRICNFIFFFFWYTTCFDWTFFRSQKHRMINSYVAQ